MKHQVKIISDGTPRGTQVFDENGKKISNVTSSVIWLENSEVVKVDLTILAPETDVVGEAHTVTMVCPVCKDELEHKCNEGEPETRITLSGDTVG